MSGMLNTLIDYFDFHFLGEKPVRNKWVFSTISSVEFRTIVKVGCKICYLESRYGGFFVGKLASQVWREYSDRNSSNKLSLIFYSYIISEYDTELCLLGLLEVDNRVVISMTTHRRYKAPVEWNGLE